MLYKEKLDFVNKILRESGKVEVRSLDDISSSIFIALHRKLINEIPSDLIESPACRDDHLANVTSLLKHLSSSVLQVSLTHISPEAVSDGQKSALLNLIDIYLGLEKYGGNANNSAAKNGPRNTTPKRSKGEQQMDLNQLDAVSARTRQRLTHTEARTERLGRVASRMIEQEEQRRQYLVSRIREVLQRRDQPTTDEPHQQQQVNQSDEHEPDKDDGQNQLWEYVKDHRDNVALATAAYSQMKLIYSNPKKRRMSVGDEELLTQVTGPLELAVVEGERDVGSSATYTVHADDGDSDDGATGWTDDEEPQPQPMDEWGKAVQEVTRSGYQQQFLNMLLEEEDVLNQQKTEVEARERQLRECTVGQSSEVAIDKLIYADNHPAVASSRTSTTRGSSARSTPRSGRQGGPDCGGVVKSVVRHFRHPVKSARSGSNRDWTPRSRVGENGGLIGRLIEEFPGLEVSEQTMRQMWTLAAQQLEQVRRPRSEAKPLTAVMEAARRQRDLAELLGREAAAEERARTQREERKRATATRREQERRRAEMARARRARDEACRGHKALALRRRDREETVFRTTVRAAVAVQRDRLREARRLSRDTAGLRQAERVRQMEALETFYRDRFSMLAETLKKERKDLDLQDRSQEHELQKLRTDMRRRLEADIRQLQQSVLEDDHNSYFRHIDGDQFVQSLRHH